MEEQDNSLANWLEQRYSIVNSEGVININKFFNTFHNGVCYANAMEKVPIVKLPKAKVSRLNPNYDVAVDRIQRTYSVKAGTLYTSVKQLLTNGLIKCERCGSTSWSDEHQFIRCNGCQDVERKKAIILNTSTKTFIKRSKDFYYAKRTRLIYEGLKPFLPGRQLKRRIERYALKESELNYVNLMRFKGKLKDIPKGATDKQRQRIMKRNKNHMQNQRHDRMEKISQFNLGMDSNPFYYVSKSMTLHNAMNEKTTDAQRIKTQRQMLELADL